MARGYDALDFLAPNFFQSQNRKLHLIPPYPNPCSTFYPTVSTFTISLLAAHATISNGMHIIARQFLARSAGLLFIWSAETFFLQSVVFVLFKHPDVNSARCKIFLAKFF